METKLGPQSVSRPPGTDLSTPTELASISQNLRDLASRFDRALAVLSVLAEAQSKIVIGLNSTPAWVPEVRKAIAELGSVMVAIVRPKNPSSLKVHRILVPTAGSPQQFPEVKIPYDYSVVVKALRSNTDEVYVAASRQDATDASRRAPLAAGESVELQVDDLSSLYIDAAVNGEGAVWIIETSEDVIVTRS